MALTICEKLKLSDEKHLLIQGLPSSIEKQFSKLSCAKNVTPLLKMRKIDFALIFVVNENQLNSILKEVIPALNAKSKFWIASPKNTSKIATDLNKEGSWDNLFAEGFESGEQVTLDHVWIATLYERTNFVVPISEKKVRKSNAVLA